MTAKFEPRIVAFLCNWCSYAGADIAGVSRIKYAYNIRIIKTMCTGRIDPVFVLKAFEQGADGVLISGCHPGECHYQDGNHKMFRRYPLLSKMLQQLGVEKDRFRLIWASAAEGEKFAREATDFTETVRKLGPFAPSGIKVAGGNSLQRNNAQL